MNFSLTSIPYNGQRVRGVTATCGHCGAVTNVPCNTFKGKSDDDKEQHFIGSRLEAIGWKVGKKASDLRCPGCFSAIKARAKQKSVERTMSNVTTIPTGKPASSMSRDDRRIIFEKLNEVYADEKTGYSADWTDGKVASDLGIARAWVAVVRDEMFGPEGGNANIRQSVDEARALLGECRKLAETFSPLLNRAEKIERTLVEIERSLR